jgi:NAD(P)-dependent dehydrogenase (short-subunit alcohol dehydrogenase family)
MDLKDSRIWLTGASSGIGAALVEPLVAAGGRVAATARRGDLLERLAARHQDGRVIAVPADVADRDAVHRAAQAIEQRWDGVDLALFNAGIGRTVAIDGFDAGPYIETMRTNVLGVVFGIEAVLPGMIRRGAGRIAVVASLAGSRGGPGLNCYGTSKAAVIHELTSLRFMLEPKGIGVTVINPGFVRTPMTEPSEFWMPGLLRPEEAAAVIIRGLRRDRKEIRFPPLLAWPVALLRVLPFPLYELLMRLVKPRRK